MELATLPATYARSLLKPRSALAAENVFLRRQIALLVEHGAKPRRPTNGTRVAMVWLSRLFHWDDALAVICDDC